MMQSKIQASTTVPREGALGSDGIEKTGIVLPGWIMDIGELIQRDDINGLKQAFADQKKYHKNINICVGGEMAIAYGASKCLGWLIEIGFSVNLAINGFLPVHDIGYCSDYEQAAKSLDMLLDHGIDINSRFFEPNPDISGYDTPNLDTRRSISPPITAIQAPYPRCLSAEQIHGFALYQLKFR